MAAEGAYPAPGAEGAAMPAPMPAAAMPGGAPASAAGGPVPKSDVAPKLTFPEAEADALRAAYAEADVILEYGSGGSTELAARMPGKTVFSVENNAGWLRGMKRWFEAHPPEAALTLHYAETGNCGDWGFPRNARRFRIWPLYATSVWDLPGFVHPDVVLIDGRFRAACFLTTLFRISRPVTVLWDDYAGRDSYHEIEQFCPPTGTIGRMAVFNAEPTPIPAEKLGLILTTYLRPE